MNMKTSPIVLAIAALGVTPAGAQLGTPERALQDCADTLAKKDCRQAKNYPMCYIYAEECAETCGCDYDLAGERTENGLDDAHYASPDFQCATGDEFEDYMHFNCTLYEGAKWCAVDAATGDVVEGPGWCSWFNPTDCNIQKNMRWPKHEGYANSAGRWAKSCCCNTGLADTYAYESEGECVDRLNAKGSPWRDANGYSCRAYHFGSFCTLEGEPGTGWDADAYGPITDYAHDGMSPLEACCTCGGSVFSNPSTNPPTPSTLLSVIPSTSPSSTPTTKPNKSNPGKSSKVGKSSKGQLGKSKKSGKTGNKRKEGEITKSKSKAQKKINHPKLA